MYNFCFIKNNNQFFVKNIQKPILEAWKAVKNRLKDIAQIHY